MYKKWLSCALSVLCSFCLFWGLYSNTLEVKADYSSFSYNVSITARPNSTVFDYITTSANSSLSGAVTTNMQYLSGSTTFSNTAIQSGQYTYHFSIPFVVNKTWAEMGNSGYPTPTRYFTYWMRNFNITTNNSGVQNICLLDSEKKVILTSSAFPAYTNSITDIGSDIWYSNTNNGTNLIYYIDFDFCSYSATAVNSVDINFTVTGDLNCRYATEQEITQAAVQVADSVAQESLQSIEESSQAIETSVTSDTGGGLLATIKNFFGGFFSNLINSILGLFVPDSTYFSTWFDNLNTLLSAKLGMLYAPFDLLISTLNAVYSADTTEPGITFPGITWDGQTVIEPYTFYFSSLGEDFQNLRDAVYFGTDVVFLFAFLHLLQKKIALVITGSEVNG